MRRTSALVLSALLTSACATPLDLERIQALLAPKTRTPDDAKSRPPAEHVPLRAPERLAARSGELRAVPLQWNPVLLGEVVGYVVERAAPGEDAWRAVATLDGRATTSWVDRGAGIVAAATTGEPAALGDGETWHYRVRARSRGGASGEATSPIASGTTAPPPAAPEELRAYSHQPRSVPLSWRPSADPTVDGYIVERGPTARGPFERIAELDGRFTTSHLDAGLGDLRVFHYRLRSINRAGGRGEPSSAVRAVTKPEPLPPLGLAVAAQRLGANELAWEPNVEADLSGYRVYRRRGGSGNAQLAATLPPGTTRYRDETVGADETLVYWLRAVDADGIPSEPSAPLEVEGLGYELRAEARAEGVVLRWTDRSAEGWVQARVLRLGPLGPTELATATGSLYLHRDTRPGRSYRYRVVLETADGRRAPPSRSVEVDVPAR